MTLAVVRTRALDGLERRAVTVEVHLANGLPSFTLVGLADTEVKEARERVRAALAHSGLGFPDQQAHHRQPGAGRSAQGVGPLRPADRPRHPGRRRPDRCRRARPLRVRRRAEPGRRIAAGARRAGAGPGRAPRGRLRARWCCPRPVPAKPRWPKASTCAARVTCWTWWRRCSRATPRSRCRCAAPRCRGRGGALARPA